MPFKLKRFIAIVMCITLLISNSFIYAIDIKYNRLNSTIILFSNSEINAEGKFDGYSINGTNLEIKSSGIYVLKGSCDDGTISIKKNTKDVVLVLDNLSLTSKSSAPLILKSSSDATIHLLGASSLTDGEEDPSSDSYEGASIKLKNSSKITFCGNGTLNINGDTKNGIKGGENTSVVVNNGLINVNSQNNGIVADGSIQINGGNININSRGDGIKSVPEADDEESLGNITINGGNIIINSLGDGIQAESLITINGGLIDITTENGYLSDTFDKETMSAKGIKASGNKENINNNIVINGGTINLNTADDAIHSDSNIDISKGKINIHTKDDAIHCDSVIKLGTENGNDRDPDVSIYSCYEGIEAEKLYGYSGRFYIIASDDGINTKNSSGYNYNVFTSNESSQIKTQISYIDYDINAMYFYGGNYYINSEGDGIDSNGNLYFYGGNFTVFSSGYGSPDYSYDSTGDWFVDGATLFGVGGRGRLQKPTQDSQKYIALEGYFRVGDIIDVMDENTILCSQENIKPTRYIFYSSPTLENDTRIEISNTLKDCLSNDWIHEWDEGVIENDVITYTCLKCGKVEHETNADCVEYVCDGHAKNTVILGDLDENGLIDANDASIILEIYKANEQTPYNISLGDMDSNGIIDANDASLILELYKTNN